MQTLASLVFLALLPSAIFAQAVENKRAFEAADVHVSGPVRFPYLRGPVSRQGRYEIRDATLIDLIGLAYGVPNEKVAGGPTWLEMEHFDVLAKPPADSTPEDKKAMLQALLAERFKLAVHNDTRPVAALALTVGKPGQLKEAATSGETGCKFVPPAPATGGGPPQVPMLSYSCTNMPMGTFAEGLNKMIVAGQYLNGNIVVDQTGIKGSWDFSFKYTPRVPPGMGATVSIIDALDKQLGLKLEPVKVPVPVIVVDSVNRKPTANVAGVAEILHITPPPTEFEVAEVKPSDPAAKGIRFQMQPGGRVNVGNITLKLLIRQAWDLPDEMVIGAPSWLGDDHFDIIAKASTEGLGAAPQVEYETILIMLRGLLKERFKLETHMEDRPVKAYTLIALKPKLKKADPTSRTRWIEGPGTDGKDPRSKNAVLSRLVTCQNMTMAEFGERLQTIASGYIQTPVLDKTGLEGSFDFTLSFSPAGMDQYVASRNRESESPAPGGAPQVSDPSGAVSLFDAIEKQLGLKLEMEKRPAPVLVIDHIERKPTDN